MAVLETGPTFRGDPPADSAGPRPPTVPPRATYNRGMEIEKTDKTGSSLVAKGVASLVLIVAALVLVKLVIGFIAGIIWIVAVVAALVAVVWAWRTLSR